MSVISSIIHAVHQATSAWGNGHPIQVKDPRKESARPGAREVPGAGHGAQASSHPVGHEDDPAIATRIDDEMRAFLLRPGQDHAALSKRCVTPSRFFHEQNGSSRVVRHGSLLSVVRCLDGEERELPCLYAPEAPSFVRAMTAEQQALYWRHKEAKNFLVPDRWVNDPE